jgi:hypothetical protein
MPPPREPLHDPPAQPEKDPPDDRPLHDPVGDLTYEPVQPKVCPSAGSARALAARLAQSHVGVIAWSRMGDPDLGEWGPPEVLVRTGVIPDEYEAGGGVE